MVSGHPPLLLTFLYMVPVGCHPFLRRQKLQLQMSRHEGHSHAGSAFTSLMFSPYLREVRIGQGNGGNAIRINCGTNQTIASQMREGLSNVGSAFTSLICLPYLRRNAASALNALHSSLDSHCMACDCHSRVQCQSTHLRESQWVPRHSTLGQVVGATSLTSGTCSGCHVTHLWDRQWVPRHSPLEQAVAAEPAVGVLALGALGAKAHRLLPAVVGGEGERAGVLPEV